MKLSFLSFLNILLDGKSSKRFLIGVIGSFAFSISVILSTVGLMDGFESTLVRSLKDSSGDLVLKKSGGFFSFDSDVLTLKSNPLVVELTPVVQIEAFALSQEKSKGVLVKGIDLETFGKVTNLKIDIKKELIAIGSELANKYSLSVGDEITLAFASNQKINQGSPILKKFMIGDIVKHHIYEKDLRFIYMDKKELLKTLNYRSSTTNAVLLKTIPYKNLSELKAYRLSIQGKLLESFHLEAFWSEFKVLIDAVKVEKFSISLILQLIVVVSIFNIIAFIIFISEKKSQEFFLLRVLGVNLKSVVTFWMMVLVFLWIISSLLSILLTKFFGYLIGALAFFELPGDIYVLSGLGLELTFDDYVLVFLGALVWIVMIGSFSIFKLKKKMLLEGLRQEFS